MFDGILLIHMGMYQYGQLIINVPSDQRERKLHIQSIYLSI